MLRTIPAPPPALTRLAGLALLAGLLGGGCSVYEPPSQVPDIQLISLQPERIGLKRQSFRLNLSLSNPNDGTIRVADGRLTLDLEDMRIGSGELIDGFSIAGGEEGVASLRIETDLMRDAPRLLQTLMASNGSLKYRVTGWVDVLGFGLGRLPVDERGRIDLTAPMPQDQGREVL